MGTIIDYLKIAALVGLQSIVAYGRSVEAKEGKPASHVPGISYSKPNNNLCDELENNCLNPQTNLSCYQRCVKNNDRLPVFTDEAAQWRRPDESIETLDHDCREYIVDLSNLLGNLNEVAFIWGPLYQRHDSCDIFTSEETLAAPISHFETLTDYSGSMGIK